jgi:hypothetical protein
VEVCDPAPASLTGTCAIHAAGQCVDFLRARQLGS